MPTLIDTAGNRYAYTSLEQHGTTISLDGMLFLPGSVADYTLETGVAPIISPMTFLMLFTPAEEIAITQLIAGNPDADPPVAANAELALWWARLNDARLTQVNLGLKSVQAALDSLVQLGALTVDRVAEILTGEPQ